LYLISYNNILLLVSGDFTFYAKEGFISFGVLVSKQVSR